MNIIVVDIDGTIAKVGDRLKYLQQEKKDWDAFYEHCNEDEPIDDIIRLVTTLYNAGYEIWFCTGRRAGVWRKTKNWIETNLPNIEKYSLLMRRDGDWRHDTVVKPETLAEFLDFCGYNSSDVFLILEDRDSMVAKWRELGYRCLQVADGKF